MIPENYKTVLNISDKQLPRFIAGNKSYESFVAFVESYYSWLAENNNVEDRTKNILNYIDIDKTLDEFEEYFYNTFLPYFPTETLTDKRELVKFSKELYRRKSTRDAFKFLFRVLYNEESDLYNTKESVLIASDGKWVQSVYIALDSSDNRFLSCRNLKIFGETSKTISAIQSVHITSNQIHIEISNLYNRYIPGEYVRIVDNFVNDVYFTSTGEITDSSNGTILRTKIYSFLSGLTIDPNNNGLLYEVGDPVVFYNGLDNRSTETFHGKGAVTDVTKGKINSVTIQTPSYGFSLFPNTVIDIIGRGASNANVIVSGVDTSNVNTISITGTETISSYGGVFLNAAAYGFTYNPSANANTAIINALQTIQVNTYPISQVTLISEGEGYKEIPILNAKSYYNNILLSDFGILAPIQINFSGYNYSNNDIINIVGGSGYGAYANVKSTDSNGSITSVQYIKNLSTDTLGGIGYSNDDLPTTQIISSNNKIIYSNTTALSVNGSLALNMYSTSDIKIGMYVSGNGIPYNLTYNYFTSNVRVSGVDSNTNIVYLNAPLNSEVPSNSIYRFDGTAILNIPTIIGDGEILIANTELSGAINSLEILDQGFGYITTPDITLKVLDVIVSMNYGASNAPPVGSKVYQSVSESVVNDVNFIGYVADYTLLSGDLYTLRLYNYNGQINTTTITPLFVDIANLNSKEYSFAIQTSYNINDFINGVKIYGNGAAKANIQFSSGVVRNEGKFLNTDGFLSSDKLLQSNIYNDFTYFITIEKEFSKYKDIIKNILHPSGTQVIGRYSIKSKSPILTGTQSAVNKTIELSNLLQDNDVYAEFISSNIIQIQNKSVLTSLSAFVTVNTNIALSTDKDKFYSVISSVDDSNNTITLTDYKLLNYSNVAYGYTNANSIVITSLTGKFDVINNGNYSNTNNHLVDIVFVGDTVTIGDNTNLPVVNIDYDINKWIIYFDTDLIATGNESVPSLVNVTRTFKANSILVDYITVIPDTFYIMYDTDYLTTESNDKIFII